MNYTLSDFSLLTDAEQYFEFFQMSYDAKVVQVNRLHILKKFSQLITKINAAEPNLTETEKLGKYRTALQQSYQLFLESNSLEQKLFKVFNQKPQNLVLLSEIGVD